jgi:prepilin-type N-terminal cleavage/methylation domain-containing protein
MPVFLMVRLYLFRYLAVSRRGFNRSHGYSLVELLVVTLLIGLAASIGWAAISPHLRFPIIFERAARQIDDASRLQNLLESEVAEASRIDYDGGVQSGCSGASTALFTLAIPYSYDPGTGRPLEIKTDYYLGSNGEFFRCGKGVESDGSLSISSQTVEAAVSSGLVVEVLSGASERYLQYRISGGGLRPSVQGGIHIGSRVVR